MKNYMDVEDLEVYQKLCRLHIEICDLSHAWPSEEKYELGSQIRRAERKLPEQERRWIVGETTETHGNNPDLADAGWPIHLTPET
jgi:hypothetical protein